MLRFGGYEVVVMGDPVLYVVERIRANDVRTCTQLAQSEGWGLLMNRRNQNIFWRALIDSAASPATAAAADPLALAKLFISNRLDPNTPLDTGELPLNVLMLRDAQLGVRAAREIRTINPNASDRHGRTPAMQAVELLRTQSVGAGFAVLSEIVAYPSFDLDVCDQGAAVCFKALALAPVAAAHGDHQAAMDGALTFISALQSKGYDFNAARETRDVNVKFGSQINTPLAYCIKKAALWMEWGSVRGSSERAGSTVWAIATELIRQGANPCLQMEAGQRVQLIDVCRRSKFPAGMLASLESGLLAQEVGPASASKKAPARRL